MICICYTMKNEEEHLLFPIYVLSAKLLLEELPVEPDNKACAAYSQDDAGDPASAEPKKVSDESADEAADYTQDHVHEQAVILALHDAVGDISVDCAEDDLNYKFDKHGILPLFLLFEVSLEKTFESLAVAGFVSGHFVYGVVDSIKIVLLCHLGKVELALGSAEFAVDSPGQVLLGGIGHVRFKLGTQQFCELRSVLGFFPGGLFPIETDLGITFSVGNSCHAQIHADFGAFALEVGLQLFDDVLLVFFGYAVQIHAYAEYVLSGKRSGFVHFLELGAGALAQGAGIAFGDGFAFLDVAAYGAYKFLHDLSPFFLHFAGDAIDSLFCNISIINKWAHPCKGLKKQCLLAYNIL